MRRIVAEIAIHQAGAGDTNTPDLPLWQREPGFAANFDTVTGQWLAAIDKGRCDPRFFAGCYRLTFVFQNVAVDLVDGRTGSFVIETDRQGVLGQTIAGHQRLAVKVKMAEVLSELRE
ncbi:hypothetical protein D3C80_998750 [compost metagenome]